MGPIADNFLFIAGGSIAVAFGTTCFLLFCMRLQGTSIGSLFHSSPPHSTIDTDPMLLETTYALSRLVIDGRVYVAFVSKEEAGRGKRDLNLMKSALRFTGSAYTTDSKGDVI